MAGEDLPLIDLKPTARERAEQAAGAGQQAASSVREQAQQLAGSGTVQRAQTAAYRPVRDTAGTLWAIVGYSLLLILLYWLVAKRKVVSGLGNFWEGLGKSARVWISSDADPLARLEKGLGHNVAATAEAAAGVEGSEGSEGTSRGTAVALPPKEAAAAAIAARDAATIAAGAAAGVSATAGAQGRTQPARKPTMGFSQRRAEQLGITPRRPAHA